MGQIEALAGDIRCRVFIVTDPKAASLDLQEVRRAHLWTPAPGRVAKAVASPRWSGRVETRSAPEHPRPAGLLMLPLFHRSAEETLLPAAVPHYEDLKSRGRLHRYALHVRSSQAFALNLFAPLEQDGVVSLLHVLGLPAVNAQEPEFEYEDVADTLAEARPHSPHRTQVNILLRGHDAERRTLIALIEVKFTETDFSGCSAYANPANPERSNCGSTGLFGSDRQSCFQLNNHGQGRRKYDTYLCDLPVILSTAAGGDGGCLVRKGLNQPMRNLALAHMLLATGKAEQVTYSLTAPAGHRVIWRRFGEVQAAFPDTDTRSVVALPTEVVAAAHPDGGEQFTRRYLSIA